MGTKNSASLTKPVRLRDAGVRELKKTPARNCDEKGKPGRPFGWCSLVGISIFTCSFPGAAVCCHFLKRRCTPGSQLINQLDNTMHDEACAAYSNKKPNPGARWARGANVP